MSLASARDIHLPSHAPVFPTTSDTKLKRLGWAPQLPGKKLQASRLRKWEQPLQRMLKGVIVYKYFEGKLVNVINAVRV